MTRGAAPGREIVNHPPLRWHRLQGVSMLVVRVVALGFVAPGFVALGFVALGFVALGCDALTEGDCNGFENQTSVGATITIVNDGSAPLNIGNAATCRPQPAFSLALDGERLDLAAGSCGTCETRGGRGGCADFCEETSVLVVYPGARHDVVWDGSMSVERTLPGRCGGEVDFVDTCRQFVAAPAGRYEVSITSFSGIQCFGSAACDCGTAGASCVLPNSAVAGAAVVQSAMFDYCSGGTKGCAAPQVELVFK